MQRWCSFLFWLNLVPVLVNALCVLYFGDVSFLIYAFLNFVAALAAVIVRQEHTYR